MCLYADGTPGFFPPPKESYLQNMADPSESLGFTMLSFYRFSEITDPDDMALKLLQLWKPFKSYGRCYTLIVLKYLIMRVRMYSLSRLFAFILLQVKVILHYLSRVWYFPQLL